MPLSSTPQGSEIEGLVDERDDSRSAPASGSSCAAACPRARRDRAGSTGTARPAWSAPAPGRSRGSGLEAAEDARLLGMRPGGVGEGHAGANLVVGAHIGAERARVVVVGVLVARDEVLRRAPRRSSGRRRRSRSSTSSQARNRWRMASILSRKISRMPLIDGARRRSPRSRPRAGRPGRRGARPAKRRAIGIGQRIASSMADLAASSRQRVGDLRPIGPSTEIGVQPSGRAVPPAPVRARAGSRRRRTRRPGCAASRRCPSRCRPAACRTPAPPPSRPTSRRRSASGLNGLPVAPQTGLRVLAPAPNSGTLVLPTTIAPASRTRATMRVVVRPARSRDRAASRRW